MRMNLGPADKARSVTLIKPPLAQTAPSGGWIVIRQWSVMAAEAARVYLYRIFQEEPLYFFFLLRSASRKQKQRRAEAEKEKMGTREVYEQKLRRGNLYHDPTINPGLGCPRCPRCLSLLDPTSVSKSLSISIFTCLGIFLRTYCACFLLCDSGQGRVDDHFRPPRRHCRGNHLVPVWFGRISRLAMSLDSLLIPKDVSFHNDLSSPCFLEPEGVVCCLAHSYALSLIQSNVGYA